jgi:hypothetical protein
MPYSNSADRLAAGRRHYDRHTEDVKDRARLVRRAARARNRDFVTQYKTDKPCADCAVVYPPYVMRLDDHGIDVDGTVATLAHVPASLQRLQAAIDKYEIVCANCHAERAHRREVAGAGFEPATSGL